MDLKILEDSSLETLSPLVGIDHGRGIHGPQATVCKKISLNNNSYDETIKISPWHPEHYSSIILYKLKLWAEKNRIRVVAEGNINYLPALCQVADELFLEIPQISCTQELCDNWFGSGRCKKCKSAVYLKEVWYCNECHGTYDSPVCPSHQKYCHKHIFLGFCSSCKKFIHANDIIATASINSVGTNANFKSREGKEIDVRWDRTFYDQVEEKSSNENLLTVVSKEINDEEIIERFWNPQIVILQSVYEKFLKIKDSLPRDVVMLVTKNDMYPIENLVNLKVPLLSRDYQRELIRLVGLDYMSFQVLGSKFLNWFFISNRGSSAILSMLPVKNIILSDISVNPYKKILKGFSKKRFDSDEVPIVGDCDKVAWHNGRVALHDYININKNIINTFIEKFLSEEKDYIDEQNPTIKAAECSFIQPSVDRNLIEELETKSSLRNKCTALIATSQSSIEFLVTSVMSLLCNSDENFLEHISVAINGPDSRTGDPSLQDQKQKFLEELRELKWLGRDMPITVSRTWSRLGHAESIDSLIPWVHTQYYLLMHDDVFVLDKNWSFEGLNKFEDKKTALVAMRSKINPLLITRYNEGLKLGMPHLNTCFLLCDKTIMNKLGIKWRGYHVKKDFVLSEEFISKNLKYSSKQAIEKFKENLSYFNMDIGAEVFQACVDNGFACKSFEDTSIFHCTGMSWLTDKKRVENKLTSIGPEILKIREKLLYMDQSNSLRGGLGLFNNYVKFI